MGGWEVVWVVGAGVSSDNEALSNNWVQTQWGIVKHTSEYYRHNHRCSKVMIYPNRAVHIK